MKPSIPKTTGDSVVSESSSSLYQPAVLSSLFDPELHHGVCNRSAPYIHKLPFEVLLLIFDLYVGRGYYTLGKCGPWLLSRVCHSWRKISISSARLWTNIYFHFSAVTPPQHIDLLLLQLNRSRSLPLSILLYYEESSEYLLESPSQPSITPLVKILYYLQQREYLDSLVEHPELGGEYPSLRSGASFRHANMNNLTVLELEECGWDDTSPDAPALLPSLKTIYIRRTIGCVFSSMITPALEDIIVVGLMDLEVNYISDLIDRSGCSLRSFRCSIQKLVCPDDFVLVLEEMDMLHELLVDFTPLHPQVEPDSDIILNRLSAAENGKFCLGPHLRQLSLCEGPTSSTGPSYVLPNLLDMLEQRTAIAEQSEGTILSELQRVELFYANGWEMASGIADRVSVLKNAGTDIVTRPEREMIDVMHDYW